MKDIYPTLAQAKGRKCLLTFEISDLTAVIQLVIEYDRFQKMRHLNRELFCDFDLTTVILNLYPSIRNSADLSGAVTEAFNACYLVFRSNYGETHSHVE